MLPYILHLDLSSVSRINYVGETIKDKFFHVLNLGYTKFFIDPYTKEVIELNCIENNIPLVQCKTGLESLTNKVFKGFFKIKEVLSPNEAIITATNVNGTENIRDYVLKKHDNTIFLYEQSTSKVHQEIFLVEKGNMIKDIFSKINELATNPVLNIAEATMDNTDKGLTETTTSIFDYFSDLFSSYNNNEITEHWTESVTNVVNNTTGNLTNYITSSTSDYSENIDNESNNTTNNYLNILVIVTGTVVVSTMIGLGCYYFKKWHNSKTTEISGNNPEEEEIVLNIHPNGVIFSGNQNIEADNLG